MAYIRSVKGREILDSRGQPTIEVEIVTDQLTVGKAQVPSGASKGEKEAKEIRDEEDLRFGGKGVLRAVGHVNGPLAQLLVGEVVFDQRRIDQLMIEKDGTDDKSHLGANALLGASLAAAKAAALSTKLPLYRYLGGVNAHLLPCPMMNILNGGVHADNDLDFQEFMIRPIGAPSFREAVRWGAEIFHCLKAILKGRGEVTAVGDEGGFGPRLRSHEEAIELILEAIEKSGFKKGKEVSLALDCAASEFYDRSTGLYIEKKKKRTNLPFVERTTGQQIDYLAKLCSDYPIDSIEDGLAEWDWDGWQRLTERLGKKVQLVGDDLFVTHPRLLLQGIKRAIANAILIKVNQIGTLSEALDTIRIAQAHGYGVILSHRSGETEETMIADIAVATNAGQIKAGSLCRSERIAKYNRLLAIEEELGTTARFKP